MPANGCSVVGFLRHEPGRATTAQRRDAEAAEVAEDNSASQDLRATSPDFFGRQPLGTPVAAFRAAVPEEKLIGARGARSRASDFVGRSVQPPSGTTAGVLAMPVAPIAVTATSSASGTLKLTGVVPGAPGRSVVVHTPFVARV